MEHLAQTAPRLHQGFLDVVDSVAKEASTTCLLIIASSTSTQTERLLEDWEAPLKMRRLEIVGPSPTMKVRL